MLKIYHVMLISLSFVQLSMASEILESDTDFEIHPKNLINITHSSNSEATDEKPQPYISKRLVETAEIYKDCELQFDNRRGEGLPYRVLYCVNPDNNSAGDQSNTSE